jgi:hypothetical protein
MSRLVLTLALALLATGCAPATESRTVIAAGPRVMFDDELRAPRNWAPGAGTLCRSHYADDGFVVESIAASTSTPCPLGPVRPEAFPAGVRIEVTARLRKGTREARSRAHVRQPRRGDNRTFATFGLTANGTYRVASWSGGRTTRCRPPRPGA